MNEKAILEKIGKTTFDNIFVIWLNEYVDLQILRLTYGVSDSMFILSENDFSKDLENSGLEGVTFSSINNGVDAAPFE